MKKIIVMLLSVLVTCVIGLGNCVFAEGGYISTTVTAQIELVPDIVDFDVEIVSTSKESMAKAISENKQISGKVYNNLKKEIEKTTGDSIKTSNYSAVPVYRYSSNKKVLDYYQVTNNIKVHTKNISKVGNMIDTAMADGATSVNNVSYSVSEYDAECHKLLTTTAAKARTQADSIAKGLGSEITGVKSIDGSCSLSGKNIMPRMYMSAKAANFDGAVTEMSAGTNIEVGTMTLNSRVSASFFVK